MDPQRYSPMCYDMAVELATGLTWLKDYESAYRRQGVDESTVQR